MCLLGLVSATAILLRPSADPVDDYIKAQMAAQKLPGLSLAVVRGGQIVKAKGYGMANLELSVAADPDNVYEIASVTKTFTAAAILLLSREGKLTLDDPACRFVPDLPEGWKGVRVRHLVTHTSGLPDFGDPVPGPRLGGVYTPEQLIAYYSRAAVKFRPGEDCAYNDFAYFLVGMIIEKASGMPYKTYMTERIFRPLGMGSTRIYEAMDVVPGRASGYTWKDGRIGRGRLTGQSATLGGGDILSTANDLAKWAIALDGDQLLPRELRDIMGAMGKLDDGRPIPFNVPVEGLKATGWGFGWWIGGQGGHKSLEHGGDISSGFASFVARYPDDGLAVIVLMNRSQGGNPAAPDAPRSWEIARGVAEFYLPGQE